MEGDLLQQHYLLACLRNSSAQMLLILLAVLLAAILFSGLGDTVFVALASTVQLAGFFLVLTNVLLLRSVSGLSRHTFLGLGVCYGIRAGLAIMFEGDTRLVKAGE
jgi:hypothetical protein